MCRKFIFCEPQASKPFCFLASVSISYTFVGESSSLESLPATMKDSSPGKPIPYVAPPKAKGFSEKAVSGLEQVHRNYYMISSLYMMEPMERTIINCIMILIVTLMLYSSWVYLPHYTWKLLVFTGILTAPEGSRFLMEDADSIFIGKSEL